MKNTTKQEATKLTNRTYLIPVPANFQSGVAVEREQFHALETFILRVAGGFTRLTVATGGWRNGEDNIVEDVFPYLITTTENQIELIASRIKEHWKQEAVLVTEISNNSFLV